MILKEVTINKYKCFQNPQTIEIGNKITVLVGTNESGKTSFLEALAKVNYFSQDDQFIYDITKDYPRKELVKFNKSEEDEHVLSCKFLIDTDLLNLIESDLCKGVILSNEVIYSYKYKNKQYYYDTIQIDQKALIHHLCSKHDISAGLRDELISKECLEDIIYIESDENNFGMIKNEVQRIVSEGGGNNSKLLENYIINKWIKRYLPKFWYYDEYYALPGRINLNEFNNNEIISKDSNTIKAFFELADISIDDILNSTNYERFIALLEASSIEITDKIFKYWSANNNLDIEFNIDTITKPNRPQNLQNIEKILDIRIRNQTYKITLPLDKRSKGFNWFFSFVIWFSKIQADSSSKYILLLDEPGLNLHASAQADLLRFFDDLSLEYQIIYTTHSPFMIDSAHLDRVRTVVETQDGSIISDSIQEKDPNTLFPLQAALGYDIAQNLFISKNNLLVEGPADLLYLTILSTVLETNGRAGLKDNITIVPVGGLDKVSTFISLLRGSKLNIVCLLDSFIDPKGKQKVEDLIKNKIIKQNKIRFFDEFTESLNRADIEDLFAKEDYIKIFNETFSSDFKTISIEDFDLKANIIPQINNFIGRDRFNHYRPAYKLSQLNVLPEYFNELSLNNFEKMFTEINKLF